jgi:DNA polymerase
LQVPATEDLGVLAEAAQTCRACSLWKNATCAVFGQGPVTARIMVVGEQPGDQEDRAGKPFVGPAGQLLNRALQAAGLKREALYLTNAVKHFKWTPRGKRRIHAKPSAREAAVCRPWLEAEIRALKPQLLVCLGGTAARSVCGVEIRVTEQRGQLIPTEFGVPALITLHPSALLRLPEGADPDAEFAKFVADLQRVAAFRLSPPEL